MTLNYIWIGFLVIAFVVGLVKLIFFQDYDIFQNMMNALFDSSKMSVMNLALPLVGAMTFWMGIMKVGEKAGMVNFLSKIVSPFFSKLFPEIPKNHPAMGSMMMNFSANMLGLGNAATPLGLKAMNELQSINKSDDTASNAQIMFLVLNTSGLTLIPVSIMALRAANGSQSPTEVFLPILLATFFATLAGIVITSLVQRINLLNWVVLAYLGGLSLLVAGFFVTLNSLPPEKISTITSVGGNLILFGVIIAFILMGFFKKVNVYATFIEGAKEGFQVVIKIIPFLVAMLVAIGIFKASGAMDYIVDGLKWFFTLFSDEVKFVDALPVAIMKPLSGGGAESMMVSTWQSHGIDSFTGKLASIFQGSTETTFYVLAVYFGSVGIKNTRHAAICGLSADFVGILASIIIGYFFFN